MNDCTPSHAQSIRLKKMSQDGLLDTADAVYAVLSEDKAKPKGTNQTASVMNFANTFRYNYTVMSKCKRDIVKGLELLKRQRERNRDAR